MSDPLAQSRTLFFKGIEHFESSRFSEARQAFESALKLAPGRPSILANLGLTHEALGDWANAARVLGEALVLDPQQADLWLTRAGCLMRSGQVAAALQAYDRAIAIAPASARAWSERGSVLRELQQLDEAARCFEKAIALGADPELHQFYLASVRGGQATTDTPRRYVESLFDDYAHDFQAHLVDQLKYRGYERLIAPLAETGRRFAHALDLGCGTGLCGVLLQPFCERIDGLDISMAMLDKARQTGVYQDLSHADLADFLAATSLRPDLIVAADVFNYVGGDLAPILASVKRILAPQGCFAFTLEAANKAQETELQPSLRHSHSESYIRRLAAENGYTIRQLIRGPLREDQREPIEALYVYLE
jgi:predicted TPR repeat methyltransferase